MHCPEDGATLKSTDYRGVRIDECPTCHGRWFDREELRQAKDRTDEDLRWLDFDPFSAQADEREATTKGRLCPKDSIGMGVVTYEKSGVRIDKCSKCHGVWLSHGEFEKIIKHLEKEVNSETAGQYGEEAARQFAQIFTGPEGPISELRDLFSVFHLLRERFAVEHPGLSQAIDSIYTASPFK